MASTHAHAFSLWILVCIPTSANIVWNLPFLTIKTALKRHTRALAYARTHMHTQNNTPLTIHDAALCKILKFRGANPFPSFVFDWTERLHSASSGSALRKPRCCFVAADGAGRHKCAHTGMLILYQVRSSAFRAFLSSFRFTASVPCVS